jgi:hypothetical protein
MFGGLTEIDHIERASKVEYDVCQTPKVPDGTDNSKDMLPYVLCGQCATIYSGMQRSWHSD